MIIEDEPQDGHWNTEPNDLPVLNDGTSLNYPLQDDFHGGTVHIFNE